MVEHYKEYTVQEVLCMMAKDRELYKESGRRASRAYQQSEKGKKASREAGARYRAAHPYVKRTNVIHNTEAHRKANRDYFKTASGKAASKRYRQSEKGKEANRLSRNRVRRDKMEGAHDIISKNSSSCTGSRARSYAHEQGSSSHIEGRGL